MLLKSWGPVSTTAQPLQAEGGAAVRSSVLSSLGLGGERWARLGSVWKGTESHDGTKMLY